MKKWYIYLLTGALLLTAAACGRKADPTVSPGPETAPVTVTETQPAGETAPPAAEPVSTPEETAETPVQTPEATATPAPTAAPAADAPVVKQLTEVTLLQSVLAYWEKGGDSFTISAGNVIDVDESEDSEWLICVSPGGDETFLLHQNPENPYQIETPAGWLFIWTVLDGLDFT